MRIPRRSYRGLPCLWLGNPSLSLGTVQGMYEWTYGILRTYIPIIVLARTDVCVPNATVVERCTVDPSDQSGILSSPRSRFGYITTIFFLVSPCIYVRRLLKFQKTASLRVLFVQGIRLYVPEDGSKSSSSRTTVCTRTLCTLYILCTSILTMYKANNEAAASLIR